jgi:hypothetical protein
VACARLGLRLGGRPAGVERVPLGERDLEPGDA